MKFPVKKQWLLIGLLALLVLISFSSNVVSFDRDTKPLVTVAKPAAQHKSQLVQPPVPAAHPDVLSKLDNRALLKDKTVDIFKGKSWYVPPPPPPPPKPAPPPIPTAPPMPYAFMGSYRGDDGRLIIFLTRGDRVYSVAQGDVLEGTYRVEEVASGQLILNYLPLNIRQTMSIGEAS